MGKLPAKSPISARTASANGEETWTLTYSLKGLFTDKEPSPKPRPSVESKSENKTDVYAHNAVGYVENQPGQTPDEAGNVQDGADSLEHELDCLLNKQGVPEAMRPSLKEKWRQDIRAAKGEITNAEYIASDVAFNSAIGSLRLLKPASLEATAGEPAHPGHLLRALMEERKVTVTALAKILGITRNHFHSVLSGKSKVTTEMAAIFEECFGTPALEWCYLQSRYDLAQIQAQKTAAHPKNLQSASNDPSPHS